MAIPQLDENGHLPPGVHEASLAEIRKRFGQFRETDRRVELCTKLDAFVREANESGIVKALIIDGSFVTSKAQPGDVDLIVVLREPLDLAAELRPDQYNVVSAKRVKARYRFDVLYSTQAPETLDPLVEFFGQVRGRPELRKGILRIEL